MRLAFLADIHGNLPALEAVLEDLRAQSPDSIYLVGDQISRVPWNNEVLEIATAAGWPAIYGNHEWVIGRIGTPQLPETFRRRELFETLYWTQETLRPHFLERIRALPGELVIRTSGAPPILMAHGVPGDPFRGIFPFTPSDQVAEALYTVDEPYVVLGHVHRPFDRCIDGRRARLRVLNGGSVGLPYNGDPRAQYLLLDSVPGGWRPTFRAVEFDHTGLRQAFEDSGMLDAVGATGELHVLTAETGVPWSSDFAWWLHTREGAGFASMDQAVQSYLSAHGPGRWAFPGDL